MPIRLPQLGTVSTPQMSSVRMPGIAPRPPDLQMPVSDMRVSARDMAAPFAALAEFGGNLAGFGDKLANIANDLKTVERRNTLDDISLSAKEIFGQLEIDAANDPDPRNLMPKFEGAAAKVESLLLSREMDPVTRREATNHVQGLRQTYRVRFATSAATGMLSQAKGVADHNTQRFMSLGQFDEAKDSVGALPDSIMPPDKKAEALWKIDQAAIDSEALQFTAQNPRAAREWLSQTDETGAYINAASLPVERRLQLIGHAERETNRDKAEFFDSMIGRWNEGNAPSIPEVLAAQSEGKIDPQNAYTLIKRLEAENPPPDDPALVGETIRRIEAFDPARDYGDNDREKTALLQTIGTQFSPARQKTLMARLREKLGGNPTNPYAGRIHEFMERKRTQGAFGEYHTTVTETVTDEFGLPSTVQRRKVDPAAYDAAQQKYFEALSRVDAFLATPEAAKLDATSLFREVRKMLPRDPAEARAANSILGRGASFAPLKPTGPLARSRMLFGDTDEEEAEEGPVGTFGEVPIPPMGGTFQGASGSVYGGKNDPNDKGINHLGERTGPGGVEGVAIPQKVMEAYGFPEATDTKAVRVVVRNGANVTVLPVVDRGTAEDLVEEKGKFVLDFTEGAAKAAGGRPIIKDGLLKGVSGLDSIEFAIVPLPEIDMLGMEWPEVRAAVMKNADARRLGDSALDNAIIAAHHEWTLINSQAQAKP